jgi:hypothetical protein
MFHDEPYSLDEQYDVGKEISEFKKDGKFSGKMVKEACTRRLHVFTLKMDLSSNFFT